MNLTEKRKLEAIAVSRLATARDLYKDRREKDLQVLKQSIETQVPADAKKLLSEFEVLLSRHKDEDIALETQQEALENRHKEEKEELQDKARALGFQVESTWRNQGVYLALHSDRELVNGTYVTTYLEPTLRTHTLETADHLTQLEELRDKYIIAIYSESDDMVNVMTNLSAEIAKLTS